MGPSRIKFFFSKHSELFFIGEQRGHFNNLLNLYSDSTIFKLVLLEWQDFQFSNYAYVIVSELIFGFVRWF